MDLSFQGIDHFRNEVGFVKLAENDQTATLTEIAGTACPSGFVFSACYMYRSYILVN